MPYYIKKPGIPANAGIGTIYYKGDAEWSVTYSDRKSYSSNPTSLLANPKGKNGGFNGASVVSE